VEFISREAREFEEGMIGYVATYRIADINKLTLNPREDEAEMGKPGADTPITFTLTQGKDSSTLTIRQHFPATEGTIGQGEDEVPPVPEEFGEADLDEMAQFAEMMKGMKIQTIIECGDEIEETNAEWWDGNRIVLIDFDMDEILSDPEKLRMLSEMEQPQSKDDFESLAQGLEGIRFDANEEIEITFR